MKDEESQNMDMSAKPADTSTPNRLEFEINGQKVWIDWDTYQAQKKWLEEQERKYWEYHFSGQRTVDIFGVEGAKEILRLQDEEDERLRRGETEEDNRGDSI